MSIRRTLVAAVLVLAGTVATTGCGADEASSAKSATVKPGADPATSGDAAQQYFAAVASNDPEVQADGLEFAVPDSPAAAYLAYLGDASNAFAAAKETRAADKLTAVDGGYQVCFADSKGCLKYSDVVVSGGKVQNFAAGGDTVDKRTAVGVGRTAPLGGLGTVEFLSRNLSASTNAFVVNLRVTSAGKPITMANDSAIYRQADGKQFAVVRVVGPSTLAANQATNVLLVFAGVQAGPGALDYAVSDAGGNDEAITLRTY